MNVAKRLKEFLKRLRKPKDEKVEKTKEELEAYRERKKFERTLNEIAAAHKPRAIHQDIGKHMKHGKQAKWYRRSIKEKKKPEED